MTAAENASMAESEVERMEARAALEDLMEVEEEAKREAARSTEMAAEEGDERDMRNAAESVFDFDEAEQESLLIEEEMEKRFNK